MTGRVLLLFVLATSVPGVSGAQVLERPQRSREPRTESTGWRQVTLSVATLGSYDDNLTAEQVLVNQDVSSQSGYTGYADGTLKLEQGKGSKLFDVSARGYVNSFRNVGLTPKYGADALVHFGTGTRHRLDLRQGLRSEPYYNIGGFAAMRPAVDFMSLPEENPLHASSSQRSWAAASRVDFTSQFSPRNVLGMSYSYDTRDYQNQNGDSRAGVGSVFYRKNLSRRSRLQVNYGYADSRFLEPLGWLPLQTHTADAGLELERAFSPTRRLHVSFGGGGIRAFTREWLTRESVTVWVPAGYGGLRLDWARTWSMSADYRRAVGGLQGISGDAFTTNAGLARVGGFIARPLELTLLASYAEGQASTGTAGAYDTYTSTAQLRLLLSTKWSAVVGYDHYQYDVRNIDPILRGLPTNAQRNAVRVGFAFNLPLVGGRERLGGQRGTNRASRMND
jgi:hypothetical protein